MAASSTKTDPCTRMHPRSQCLFTADIKKDMDCSFENIW